jgi:hypothetical protein
MQMAPEVLDSNPNPFLLDAVRRAYDEATQVSANDWECDRLASKIVELVQAGEVAILLVDWKGGGDEPVVTLEGKSVRGVETRGKSQGMCSSWTTVDDFHAGVPHLSQHARQTAMIEMRMLRLSC